MSCFAPPKEESQLDLLYDDDVDDDYVERSTGIVFDQFEGETIEPVESIEEEDDQGKGEQKEDVIEGITEDTQRIKNTCQVHPRFHGIIIGKKHSKINELMKETGCKIKIPNKNSGSSEIGNTRPRKECSSHFLLLTYNPPI